MKTIHAVLVGLALAAPTLGWAAGGVALSPHDMSTNSVWNTRKGLCSPCHSAHLTDPAQLAPLWNHKTSTATFIPYNSPTMNAGTGLPSGTSLACLSCHDGTVALNEGISGTNGGPTLYYIDPSAVIGPDLHTTHPISFTYNTALALADGGLEDPAVYKIGDPKSTLSLTVAPVPATWSGTSLTGKTINEALLISGKMECSSCHDVHKQEGASPSSGILLRITGNDSSGRGSTICRTCHVK